MNKTSNSEELPIHTSQLLNVSHLWQIVKKVIRCSECFTTPLNQSCSFQGYNYSMLKCIPCWLKGIWFFLMNSSISNSLKWLFYLMHFPYSSWTRRASLGDEGRWSPGEGCPVSRSVNVSMWPLERDLWTRADCDSPRQRLRSGVLLSLAAEQ